MRKGSLVARVVIVLAALATQGTICSTGPDCTGACDFVQNCPTLNKTFFLSCSPLAPTCDTNAANCAACIMSPGTSCNSLASGSCDCACVPGLVCNNGVPVDAGTPDAGAPDAGANDAGAPDAGP